jgi:glycosyltransferase involved in cell wall biosynthesis
MTFSPVECSNSYNSDALFCLGPNLFNVQGYYLFLFKLLPLIVKSRPDFRLKVTGHFYGDCKPVTSDEVSFDGFISDLRPVYENARFFLCPVFAGTGQQIKIVEAMAHGLAVVAFRNAADRSPLIHGQNGFIADNVTEFADYVLRLWGIVPKDGW